MYGFPSGAHLQLVEAIPDMWRWSKRWQNVTHCVHVDLGNPAVGRILRTKDRSAVRDCHIEPLAVTAIARRYSPTCSPIISTLDRRFCTSENENFKVLKPSNRRVAQSASRSPTLAKTQTLRASDKNRKRQIAKRVRPMASIIGTECPSDVSSG